MIKSIFFKIMSDEQQHQKLNSLTDKTQIYNLFCENGYTKSVDDFEKELEIFLNSEDIKNLMNNDFGELSDEMLEMVAGGALNFRKAVKSTLATLFITTSVGAMGSQIMQQNKTTTSYNSAPSISSSVLEDSNFPNNNYGPIFKQITDKQPDNIEIKGPSNSSQSTENTKQIKQQQENLNEGQQKQSDLNKTADILQNKIQTNAKTTIENLKKAAKENQEEKQEKEEKNEENNNQNIESKEENKEKNKEKTKEEKEIIENYKNSIKNKITKVGVKKFQQILKDTAGISIDKQTNSDSLKKEVEKIDDLNQLKEIDSQANQKIEDDLQETRQHYKKDIKNSIAYVNNNTLQSIFKNAGIEIGEQINSDSLKEKVEKIDDLNQLKEIKLRVLEEKICTIIIHTPKANFEKLNEIFKKQQIKDLDISDKYFRNNACKKIKSMKSTDRLKNIIRDINQSLNKIIELNSINSTNGITLINDIINKEDVDKETLQHYHDAIKHKIDQLETKLEGINWKEKDKTLLVKIIPTQKAILSKLINNTIFTNEASSSWDSESKHLDDLEKQLTSNEIKFGEIIIKEQPITMELKQNKDDESQEKEEKQEEIKEEENDNKEEIIEITQEKQEEFNDENKNNEENKENQEIKEEKEDKNEIKEKGNNQNQEITQEIKLVKENEEKEIKEEPISKEEESKIVQNEIKEKEEESNNKDEITKNNDEIKIEDINIENRDENKEEIIKEENDNKDENKEKTKKENENNENIISKSNDQNQNKNEIKEENQNENQIIEITLKEEPIIIKQEQSQEKVEKQEEESKEKDNNNEIKEENQNIEIIKEDEIKIVEIINKSQEIKKENENNENINKENQNIENIEQQPKENENQIIEIINIEEKQEEKENDNKEGKNYDDIQIVDIKEGEKIQKENLRILSQTITSKKEAYEKKLNDIKQLETDKQKLNKEYEQQLLKQTTDANELFNYTEQAKKKDTLANIDNDPTCQKLTKTLQETKQKITDLSVEQKLKLSYISQANREAENLLKEITKLESGYNSLLSESKS